MIRFAACMVFVTALGGTAGAGDAVIRLSEPVHETRAYEEFGARVDESIEPVSLSELIDGGDRYLDRPVLVATRIAKVCQKKGCFFIAQEGEAVARITFKDYGFFIPTDAAGKRVVLNGVFGRRLVDTAEQRHLANDLGEPPAAASAPVTEYHIVATAVRIPKG